MMVFSLSILSVDFIEVTMKRFRIGNDIRITWEITKKGQPAELEGKDVKIYLSHEKGREKIPYVSITGNVIEILFEGLKQSVLGKYTLTADIRENEGKSRYLITDKCNAFELVGRSCVECPESDYTLTL